MTWSIKCQRRVWNLQHNQITKLKLNTWLSRVVCRFAVFALDTSHALLHPSSLLCSCRWWSNLVCVSLQLVKVWPPASYSASDKALPITEPNITWMEKWVRTACKFCFPLLINLLVNFRNTWLVTKPPICPNIVRNATMSPVTLVTSQIYYIYI